MLNRKTLGVAGAAVLCSSVALIGTNTAHAAIDVDADPTTTVKYAKETLLRTATVPADDEDAPYCVVESGSDDLLHIRFKMEQFPSVGETVYLRYDLENMVFAQQVLRTHAMAVPVESDGTLGAPTGITGANVQVNEAGTPEDDWVIIGITAEDADSNLAGGGVFELDVMSLGVMPDNAGSIEVGAYDTLPNARDEEAAFRTARADDAVEVVYGIEEKADPAQPPATAEVSTIPSFIKFTDAQNLVPVGSGGLINRAKIGKFSVGLVDGLRAQNGAEVTMLFGTDATDLAALTSEAVYMGDFSVIDAHLDVLANCNTATAATGHTALADSEDDPTMTDPVGQAEMEMYLCATVLNDNEMPIPESVYTVAMDYDKVGGTASERKFDPMGMPMTIGEIVHNGMTVHIPFLTTNDSYNQRIVIMNRGPAATYSMSFTEEAGITANGGGGHTGDLASGMTTMLVMNAARASERGQMPVVNLTGGTRTSATFTATASPANVDITVVTVNLADGTFDSVQYIDQSFHRTHLTVH